MLGDIDKQLVLLKDLDSIDVLQLRNCLLSQPRDPITCYHNPISDLTFVHCLRILNNIVTP